MVCYVLTESKSTAQIYCLSILKLEIAESVKIAVKLLKKEIFLLILIFYIEARRTMISLLQYFRNSSQILLPNIKSFSSKFHNLPQFTGYDYFMILAKRKLCSASFTCIPSTPSEYFKILVL